MSDHRQFFHRQNRQVNPFFKKFSAGVRAPMSDHRRDCRCQSLPLTQFFQNFDIRVDAVVADHHNAPTPRKDPCCLWYSPASEAPALTPCPSPLLRVQKRPGLNRKGRTAPTSWRALIHALSISACTAKTTTATIASTATASRPALHH